MARCLLPLHNRLQQRLQGDDRGQDCERDHAASGVLPAGGCQIMLSDRFVFTTLIDVMHHSVSIPAGRRIATNGSGWFFVDSSQLQCLPGAGQGAEGESCWMEVPRYSGRALSVVKEVFRVSRGSDTCRCVNFTWSFSVVINVSAPAWRARWQISSMSVWV